VASAHDWKLCTVLPHHRRFSCAPWDIGRAVPSLSSASRAKWAFRALAPRWHVPRLAGCIRNRLSFERSSAARRAAGCGRLGLMCWPTSMGSDPGAQAAVLASSLCHNASTARQCHTTVTTVRHMVRQPGVQWSRSLSDRRQRWARCETGQEMTSLLSLSWSRYLVLPVEHDRLRMRPAFAHRRNTGGRSCSCRERSNSARRTRPRISSGVVVHINPRVALRASPLLGGRRLTPLGLGMFRWWDGAEQFNAQHATVAIRTRTVACRVGAEQCSGGRDRMPRPTPASQRDDTRWFAGFSKPTSEHEQPSTE